MKKCLTILLMIVLLSANSWDYRSYSRNDGPSSGLFNPASLFLPGRSIMDVFFSRQNGADEYGLLLAGDLSSIGLVLDDSKRCFLNYAMAAPLGNFGLGFNYHYDISKISNAWRAGLGGLYANRFVRAGLVLKWGGEKDVIFSLTLRPLGRSLFTLSFDVVSPYDGLDDVLFENSEYFFSALFRPVSKVGIFATAHFDGQGSYDIRGGLSLYSGKSYLAGEFLDKDDFRMNLEAAAASGDDEVTAEKERIVTIELNGNFTYECEKKEKLNLSRLLAGKQARSFIDLILKLEEQAHNKKVRGFYIEIDENTLSLGQLHEIREILKRAKMDNNAKIVVYFKKGIYLPDYYFASIADKIIMEKGQSVFFSGFGADLTFYKGLFEKLGVKGEMLRPDVCIYKAAAESYTGTKASDPFRENILTMVSVMYRFVKDEIYAARGLDIDQLSMTEMFITGPRAVELKIVDAAEHPSDAAKYFDGKYAYTGLTWRYRDNWNIMTRNSIGVISLEGAVVDYAVPGPFSGENLITPAAYKRMISSCPMKDIILIVRSPGGSGSASDMIYEITEGLKQAGKNVYVYMYDVAGSGGYYISCNALKIYASPFVITGSIGVLGGKFSLEGLYKKLGLTSEVIAVGQNNGIFSQARDFTDDEKNKIKKHLTEFYELFLERAVAGRNIPYERMSELAKGRVYSGLEAEENGLIDETGTFLDVVEFIKKKNNWKEASLKQLTGPSSGGFSLGFGVNEAFVLFGMKPAAPMALMEFYINKF